MNNIYQISDWFSSGEVWSKHFYNSSNIINSYTSYAGAIHITPNGNMWEISITNNMEVKRIYLSIYKSYFLCKDIDQSKQHVDLFLNKLNKLKAFL